MIVDTSALIAILLGEPGARPFLRRLVAEPVAISAATLVETRIVMSTRRGALGGRRLQALLRDVEAEVVAVDAEQADAASDAYRDFGRGSGHPARLSYGDCFSYALAAVRNEPLLFKGDDFAHTDVKRVA